jgi:hypothetical protein
MRMFLMALRKLLILRFLAQHLRGEGALQQLLGNRIPRKYSYQKIEDALWRVRASRKLEALRHLL